MPLLPKHWLEITRPNRSVVLNSSVMENENYNPLSRDGWDNPISGGEKPSKPPGLMSTGNKIALGVVAAVLIVAASPIFEASQDTIVGEAAITETCFDRHGYNIFSRWSCRSAFHRIGLPAMVMGCALKKYNKNDFCDNFEKINAANKRD
jgi:hypothetical protein